MKSKLVLCLFISLFIISCSDKGTEPYNPEKEIWPLAVGNIWIYRSYEYHSSNPNICWPDDTITVYVSKKLKIYGEDWYSIAVNGQVVLLGKNKVDGFWGHKLVDFTEVKNEKASIQIKYPTYAGDQVMDVNSIFLTLSLDNEITTRAGTFNCIRYNYKWLFYAKNNGEFYCPGYGLISSRQILSIDFDKQPADTFWTRMDLINYKINK